MKFLILIVTFLPALVLSFSTLPSDIYLRHLEASGKRCLRRQSRYCKDWGDQKRPQAAHRPTVQEQVLSTKLKIIIAKTKKPTQPTSESGTFRIEQAVPVNFTHIGGYSEVKEELMQVVHFMRHPELYQQYNVRLPRGVLLHGPPGTGKTLLARCTAGEANISFIATSGSIFQQKFVGVGSQRIRELFDFARTNAPCIVFIDEVDALARQRSGDGEAAHAERDTTLNQLLVELDGFSPTDRVMLMAATNRADILDGALTRSGRIDKTISIGLPDAKTRAAIVKIHSHNKPLNVSAAFLIDITSGLSGADIESLLNEVTLYGIRNGILPVNETQVEAFHEHLLLGRSASPTTLSETMLKRVAIHEIGHVLTSLYMERHPRVRKVSIASSASGTPGYTMFESADDLSTKEYLEERMCVLMGGRAAEEIIYGSDQVSTGAAQDLHQCREIAESMLGWGFGSKVIYPRLGAATRENMDADIDFMTNSAYKRATRILERNIEALTALADLLLEKKTLKYPEIIGSFE
jgi:cell division protease FtsH